MLRISHTQLAFNNKEHAKNLSIKNEINETIIYKIQTTSLEVLATPNCGFIKGLSSLSILIKTSTLSSFEAKLQIRYAMISHTVSSFDEEWQSLPKKAFQNKVIKLSRSEPISNKVIEKEQTSKELDEWEQLYKQQKSFNNKLRQQLQITQQKLKSINEERLQLKVNKSIGIVCEEYHTSFTTLLLLGVFSFVVGFILSKFD